MLVWLTICTCATINCLVAPGAFDQLVPEVRGEEIASVLLLLTSLRLPDETRFIMTSSYVLLLVRHLIAVLGRLSHICLSAYFKEY